MHRSPSLPEDYVEAEQPNGTRRRRRSGRLGPLPRDAVATLKAWITAPSHVDHPYPTDAEKRCLSNLTGITQRQISVWFVNARKRFWPRHRGSAALAQAQAAGLDSNALKFDDLDRDRSDLSLQCEFPVTVMPVAVVTPALPGTSTTRNWSWARNLPVQGMEPVLLAPPVTMPQAPVVPVTVDHHDDDDYRDDLLVPGPEPRMPTASGLDTVKLPWSHSNSASAVPSSLQLEAVTGCQWQAPTWGKAAAGCVNQDGPAYDHSESLAGGATASGSDIGTASGSGVLASTDSESTSKVKALRSCRRLLNRLRRERRMLLANLEEIDAQLRQLDDLQSDSATGTAVAQSQRHLSLTAVPRVNDAF